MWEKKMCDMSAVDAALEKSLQTVCKAAGCKA